MPSISDSLDSSTNQNKFNQGIANKDDLSSASATDESSRNVTEPTVNEQSSSSTTVEEDDTEFRAYCKQLLLLNSQRDEQIANTHNTTYNTIPMFYHKLPKNSDGMAQKLREEARTLFLQKRSKELLDNNELKVLWGLLEKNYTLPAVNTEQFISYDDYLKVVRLAGEKCK